ncbi:M14 family zinc carboxypeptidase [Pelagibaculum spongiae]|uniref:carboxypeptidase T n=1 Tax=Pelagibaculum spongiae TaxID=2080658 RepID=A0A2V1H5P6_9GAMM|nr:M14 family zinc carboxypeptidase [Pelagibaculum spongiae]PVZ72085.1 carboxypeptidase [Pelagibaculum spongiae]
MLKKHSLCRIKPIASSILAILGISSSLLFSPLAQAENIQELIEQEVAQSDSIVKAVFPSQDIARKASITFHSQLLESHLEQGYLVMDLSPEDQQKLVQFGFSFTPAVAYIEQRNQRLGALALQQFNPLGSGNAPFAAINAVAQSIPGYSCYETVEESFAAAAQMESDYPNLASWIDVGDSWKKQQGLGGHDIRVLKLTNTQTSGDKPVLFINSAIHAREYTTAALTLDFARQLVEGYGENADITWVLDNHQVHIMLQTNPDGRKKAETGISWRKNTNQNFCSPTSNKRGVDLNRNFTHGWNSANGSSGSQCNDTYRGPTPASEPETQAIESYVRSLWPDRRGPNDNDAAPADTQGIHLDVHSYSELILWPWGHSNTPAPNGDALQALGRRFAWFNNYTPQQSIGLYPTDGTSDGVSYGELGVPAYTFELGTAFFQSCSVYQNTIKPKNLPALLYAAKVVRAPYITPSGPDVSNIALTNNAATGGVPAGSAVTVTAQITDTRFNQNNGTETTHNISAAEYYLDIPPWKSGATANALTATDGGFNQKTEVASATINTSGLSDGKHMVYLRAKDASGIWGPISASFLVIGEDTNPPAVEYCAAQGNNSNEEWISQVAIGSFNQSSNASGYSDFTEQNGGSVVSLAKGDHSVSLTPSFSGSSYNEGWKVWIDFNQDGDFDDAGETVFAAAPSKSAASGQITIPATANEGKTAMRVAMRYNQQPSSCGSFNYGEVEDYTVEITAGDSGGNNQLIYENQQSQSIPDQGSITSSINVAANAPLASSAEISVTLNHSYHGDLKINLSKGGQTLLVKNNDSNDGLSGNKTYSATLSTSQFSSFSGDWSLQVQDVYNQDTGSLQQWQIRLIP